VRTLALDEAIDLLGSPYVDEQFSALTGSGVFLVDLCRGGDEADAIAIERASAALARLPCPTLALGANATGPAAAALAATVDVVADADAELEPVLATILAMPLASTALVQLLRHSEAQSVHEALIAESLVYSMLQSGPEFSAWRSAHEQRRSERPPRKPELSPAVLARREGDRLDLTLNRPKKHNAFSAEMRDALCEGLRVALGDASIREVRLRGAGRSFSSGGDLDEFGTLPDPVTAHITRSTRHAGRLLADCANRVVCFVHGACVGAGVELPSFARRVVAAPDAHFQLPEMTMGLVPGAGGTASIPRRIGRQRATWLALSGERIDAETALRWGLVDEVAERDRAES
jgi:enoyl-CoA hydratase/carnithine racemase